jgi:hypothetical protein
MGLYFRDSDAVVTVRRPIATGYGSGPSLGEEWLATHLRFGAYCWILDPGHLEKPRP